MLTRMATNKLTPARRVRYRLAPTSKKIEARNAAIMDARDRLRTRSAPDRNRGMKRRGDPLRVGGRMKNPNKNSPQKKPKKKPREFELTPTSQKNAYKMTGAKKRT